MSKKVEDLSTVLRREVREAYLNKMGTDIQFVLRPTLDDIVFRTCFAKVAHRHGIRYHKGAGWLTQEQQDDRRQYVYYLRQARRAVVDAVARLEKNEHNNRPPVTVPKLSVRTSSSPGAGPSPEVAERLRASRAFLIDKIARTQPQSDTV